ncbi:hypothetical protein [Catellatospora tritici]|uniref:hypothetical protein n=1 Tax=Catellatospora tritici TaxID=2851566 RepID=UPI001C2CD007|nr:hypothetical protein [Catellatospora tritici]MBV1855748.1 hypothetical protein [Catellatospora tritici]
MAAATRLSQPTISRIWRTFGLQRLRANREPAMGLSVASGRGVVHNSLLLHRPERTVVYGPFRPAPRSIMTGQFSLTPKPPWFVTNRTAATTGRRLTEFAARPRWTALPAIFASALRG